MTTKKFLLSAVVGAFALVSSAFAQIHSYAFYADTITLKSSTGVDIAGPVLSGEFGVFTGGFTPTTSNTGDWTLNFATAPNSIGYIDTGSPEWSLAFGLTSNAAPFAANSQLVLWVYNSKSTNPGSEWLLLSDPSWRIATYDPVGLPINFQVTANTFAVVGNLNAGVATSVSSVVIPETSTYAAILGALTLGVVGVRRWRKSAK